MLIVAALVLASCSGSPDSDAAEVEQLDDVVASAEATTTTVAPFNPNEGVRSNAWHLQTLSPDGGSLLVVAGTGGCTSHRGFDVETTASVVTINATAWLPSGNDVECTSEGRVNRALVQLDAPLGDRQLAGCLTGNCRDLDYTFGVNSLEIVASDQYVVRSSSTTTEIFDAGSGERIVEAPNAWDQVLAGDLLLIDDGREETTTAIQPDTGEVVWETTGSLITADEELVLIDRGGRLVAFDAATGEMLWNVDTLGLSIAIFGESLIANVFDGDGRRLVVLEKSTGEIATTQRFADDFNSSLFAFDDGVVVVGERQAVVFDTAGNEIFRTDGGLGTGLVDGGDLVLVSDSIVRMDPHQRANPVAWRAANAAVGLESAEVVVLTAGNVALVNANTGDETWSTPIDSTVEMMAAALTTDRVIVRTSLFVASLDRATGELEWWTEVEPDSSFETVIEN